MGNRVETLLLNAGPDGGSAFVDNGDSFTLQNHGSITASTTLANFPMQTVTQADSQVAGGMTPGSPGSSLVPTSGVASAILPIQRLNGAQITLASVLVPTTTLAIGIRVMRSIDTLGSQIAAAGGALTSIPLARPLSTALVSGATFVLTNAAAGTAQTWTTSAAVAAGSLSIPVTSQTPSATFTAGTKLVFQVGNMPAFGWSPAAPPSGFTGVGTSGTGTPTLPASGSVLLPAFSANAQVITPGNAGSYVVLFPGDDIELLLQTSSGTTAIPVGNVQPLIA